MLVARQLCPFPAWAISRSACFSLVRAVLRKSSFATRAVYRSPWLMSRWACHQTCDGPCSLIRSGFWHQTCCSQELRRPASNHQGLSQQRCRGPRVTLELAPLHRAIDHETCSVSHHCSHWTSRDHVPSNAAQVRVH